MRTVKQRSSAEFRVHTFDVQGNVAVPQSAHWKLMRGSVVVQDWTELTVNVTIGGEDCYVDVALAGTLTVLPGDHTALVTFDKDMATEFTHEEAFKVRQVVGR